MFGMFGFELVVSLFEVNSLLVVLILVYGDILMVVEVM